MSKKPLISIIITSYNQAKFLESAIVSVIDQDYEEKEIVLIDGGSHDQSLEIIKTFEKQIRYWVSEPDNGQAHAINKGFTKAEGEIITFLSSDDIYLPNTFSCVAEKWQKHPGCGAIVGGFKHIDANGNISTTLISPQLPYQTPIDLSSIPPEKWRLHQVSTFYSRKALDHLGRYVREDLRYVMDRELLFRVANHYEIILDDRPYAAFRRHTESKSMSSYIPFGEEFSRLYLGCPSKSKEEKENKEKIAKYFRAKGYFSFAKYHPNLFKSSSAFFRAAQIHPKFLLTKVYWVGLLKRLVKGNPN